MIYRLLKRIHHQLLVWLMLSKKTSLFGNQIQVTEGGELSDYPVSPVNLTVVVLNHNNQQVIGQCLNSLIRFNAYDYQIVVVDNASTDNSANFIETTFAKNVTLVKNPINGCASGRNLGVKAAKTEYILFLDSDQGPTQARWLDGFLRLIQSKPEIGMVGWHGGFFTDEKTLTGPTMEYFPNQGVKKGFDYRTNVDFLGAGGMLISKKLIEKLGGFDAKYDPHAFEDADLSRKVLDLGKQIAYCPKLAIYHLAHSTTATDKTYSVQFAKNASYFRKKWGLTH